ncbi:hypothetical protein POTOM_055046 [Populus tomentosa]|uniref:Pentatricopeptide repeat-containing protein n=1 Tax=Populus tomentosa TaxID=118781 RepID=A0A8X7Y3J7_POPTO|nr:hypothetical protein POTOM_055046 [Populus tomentosa]
MHPPNNQQCKPILTLASALISMAEACNSMSRLKQIHAHSLLTGLHDHSIILAKMLRFAAVSPSGDLAYAQRLFDQLPHPSTFFYNTLIRGYAKSSIPSYSLYLVNQMRQNGVDPDEFTFNFLIKARSRVRVNINRVRPDEVTLVSVISACTNLGDLQMGYSVHSYIDENGFGWMVSLCNALIDMYAKCGCMDRAWEVFNSMSRKSLVTWNSMISACANNRNPEDAFGLFSRMFDYGVAPDGVTFLAVLTAYAHVGLVDEGYRLFESMQRDHGIEARIEHYGCMVNMLGQAGWLEEAFELISNMPLPSNDVVWGVLLAACRKHGDEYMGERVVKKLLELKPDGGMYLGGDALHILLSGEVSNRLTSLGSGLLILEIDHMRAILRMKQCLSSANIIGEAARSKTFLEVTAIRRVCIQTIEYMKCYLQSIICDGGFVKSTGGGGNKQRFYMDSKQEAKMFEALEIEEAVVLEMNLAFLM